MTTSTRRHRRKNRIITGPATPASFLALLAALFLFTLSLQTAHAAFFWRNAITSGNWSTTGNWSQSSAADASATNAVLPGATVPVNIANTDGLTHTVTYNYTGAAVTLGSLTIDLTGGVGATSDILSMAANALTVNVETVGLSGVGSFVQSGGTNTITGGSATLTLGANVGSNGALHPQRHECALRGHLCLRWRNLRRFGWHRHFQH